MQFVPTTEKIQIKWFVYAGGEKIARVSTMRGRWDWDASCSCGWETKTGGAKGFVAAAGVGLGFGGRVHRPRLCQRCQ
jgi:hypothetical protein